MAKKDYYKILGITDEEKKLTGDEFNKLIKKKYRKIAIEKHPDKQVGKSEEEKKKAEDEFKEASEAYSVLSDEKKRAEYDSPASDFNFSGGFNGMNMDEILRGFGFGGFDPFDFGIGSPRQKRVVKGKDIRIKMSVSLKDVLNGVTKKIKYKRLVGCDGCGGSGKTDKSVEEKCPHCHGTGMQTLNNGAFRIQQTCSNCGGKGIFIKNPCPKCNGLGVISKSEEVEITIPKGVSEGMQLKLDGHGNAPDNMNGVFGDLLVLIIEEHDEKFNRQGNDLYTEINVPVLDAMIGTDVTVDTVDDKKLTAKIKPGTENGTILRFKGYGLPQYGYNDRGYMYGEIKLSMPKSLNEEEIELIKQLKTKEHFK